MLALPQGERAEGARSQGDSDTRPIELQGATADEFRDLLRVLYAKYVTSLVLHRRLTEDL